MKVLLVDDAEFARMTLKRLLDEYAGNGWNYGCQ